jgi:hypothetical protein
MSNTDEPKVAFDEGGFSFSLGGLTSGKIAIIFAAISTVVGALWAGFQVYQQFLTMQEVTAAYVPPDLSGLNERISVLDERITSVERLTRGNGDALDYLTGSLSSSVTSTRQTVDAVSGSVRSSDAMAMQTQRAIVDQLRQQDREQQQRVRDLEANLRDSVARITADTDQKIQRTLANPLAGSE